MRIVQRCEAASFWVLFFIVKMPGVKKKLRATAVRLLGALFHLSFKRWSNQGICQADDICSRRIPCPRDSGCRHKTQKSPNCKNHTPPKTKIFPWKSIVGRWNVLLKWSLFRWHLNFLGYLYGGFPVDIFTKTDSFLEGLDLAVVYLKNYSLDKAQAKDSSISP